MKYNIGDVVKLRDDLEVGKEYGEEKLNEAMNDAIGKKAEIKDCYNDRYYAKFASRYGGYWLITDEMIEGLWDECKEKQDKLKLIDVLNMVAKGELKEGTKVIYDEETYIFNDENELERELGFTLLDDIYMNNLSDEAELIEPQEVTDNTKIEELNVKGLCEIFEGKHTVKPILAFSTALNKLNEVIRYINKED